jgi:hypothetical protein
VEQNYKLKLTVKYLNLKTLIFLKAAVGELAAGMMF